MNNTGPGTYYDGHSARPNRITVSLTADETVEAAGDDGVPIAAWPLDLVRMVDAPPGILRMRVEPDDGARLEVTDALFARVLITRCPFMKNKAAIDRSTTYKIVGWSVAACVSMLLLAVYGVPALAERLVPLIPHSVDRQIGAGVKASLSRQLSNGATCKPDPAAERAFRLLTERLLAHADDLRNGADFSILPSPIRNAFALPGGHVMILSGLLERSESADELAGVLAHELGHVAGRHSMRKLVSETGLYFLLGMMLEDFGGGTVIIAGGRAILSAGYSREVERAADDYALSLMHRAGGDPKALATMLERIAGIKLPVAFEFFSTHPLTEERVAEIREKAEILTAGASRASILSPEDWRNLKSYCTNKS